MTTATLTTPTTFAIGSLPELTASLCRILAHTYRAVHDPEFDYTSVDALVPGTDLLWWLDRVDSGISVNVATLDCGIHRYKDGVAPDDVLDTLRRLLANEPEPTGGSRDTGPF